MKGVGAAEHPGRWNHEGVKVIYSSQNLQLAQLELLAYLNEPCSGFKWIAPQIPKSIFAKRKRITVSELNEFGFDWRAHPAPATLQEIGTDWFNAAQSLILEVPSVVSPTGTNFLINPRHREFKKVTWQPAEPLEWEYRLFKGKK
jgi:RES domain-containing protein